MNSESAPSAPTGEIGNTDNLPPSNSRKPTMKYIWAATINNWCSSEYEQALASANSLCKKFVIGKEVGESGTPHLQCYFNLINKARLTELKKIPGWTRASFSECRNQKALEEYCQKDGDFVSKGLPKKIKIISELRPWQKKIEDILLGPIDDRKVYWFYDYTGNIGKSALVKYLVVKYKALFCDGGKKSDIINLVFNNDMDSCNCVIWDIPRASKGSVSYATLESVKNGMICNTKYETGVKLFNSPHIFVFANFRPERMEDLSEDRWEIIDLTLLL